MKKLILLLVIVALAIAGIWFFEGQNGSLFGIFMGDTSIPLIGNKSKDVAKSNLDHKIEPTNGAIPVNPANTINNLPIKLMAKKTDPAMLGDVPSFILTDLYSSLQDPKIDTDLNALNDIIDKFIKDYKGKVIKLQPFELLNAIKRFEALQEYQYKISEISMLSRDLNVTDVVAVKLYAKIEQKNAYFNAKMAFFGIELTKLSDTQLAKAYKDKKATGLVKYQPFLDDVRKFAKYTLSEDLEKMSIQKNITANEAWSNLYSNILSTISFKINGETFNLSQASSLVNSKDADIRKNVVEEIGKALKNNAMPITMSINSIMKDKRLEDEMRGYATPIAQRNLQNGVDDIAVNNLMTTVKANYAQTIQRYYKIKAKLLGMQKLSYSDRLAPMPFDDNNSKVIKWNEAKATVIASYKQFSPVMSTIAEKFLNNGWIDARLLDNKVGGGYCDPGVPSNHPYILINYNGKNIDVLTVAHEVGHGIHSMLSYPNGMLMFSPGLTVAETASLFGENLTFASLLKNTQNGKEKAVLLADKIERNISSVIMAVVIADFENKIHNASKNGDLSTEDINAIWLSCLKESYGDTVDLSELDGYRWSGIGHIFRSPFYYYAYAFSQLMVNSLYDVYDKKSVANFEDKMITLLSSGSTKKYKELLAPFGLNPGDQVFWKNGINAIIKMIDDFETLVNTDHDIQSVIPKSAVSTSTLKPDNSSEVKNINQNNTGILPKASTIEAIPTTQAPPGLTPGAIPLATKAPIIQADSVSEITSNVVVPLPIVTSQQTPLLPSSPLAKNANSVVVKLPK